MDLPSKAVAFLHVPHLYRRSVGLPRHLCWAIVLGARVEDRQEVVVRDVFAHVHTITVGTCRIRFAMLLSMKWSACWSV